MKKLILSLLTVLILTGSAFAQQWYPTNQITVAWDPVTVSSGTVSYKVYTRPAAGGTETLFATTPNTESTVTFTVEGKYFLGVRSVRTVDGIDIESSTISWSNVASDVLNGATFGAQYYLPPSKAGGLRIK